MQRAFSAICNLLQNPAKVPVCGVFAPALLRNGKLWVMFNQHDDDDDADAANATSVAESAESAAAASATASKAFKVAKDKERYLLGDEHLTLMGVPMVPACSGRHAFPHIGISDQLSAGSKRSLAGNATCLHLHVWLPCCQLPGSD